MHCVFHRPGFKSLLHSCGTEVIAQGTGVIHTNWSDFDVCFQSKQAPLEGFHQHSAFICRQASVCQRAQLPLWIISSVPTHRRGLSESVIEFPWNINKTDFLFITSQCEDTSAAHAQLYEQSWRDFPEFTEGRRMCESAGKGQTGVV